MRKRRIKRKALIKRMSKNVNKIIKIQALLRGHYVRVKNETMINKVRKNAPKKTKKYQ